jgi:antitoxin component of MazEF toxin-antitoxin module
MNTRLKITKIGNSAGVVLPRDLLAHLGASVGETLSVTKPRTGSSCRRFHHQTSTVR